MTEINLGYARWKLSPLTEPKPDLRKNFHWSMKLEQWGNRGWRYYPNRIVK